MSIIICVLYIYIGQIGWQKVRDTQFHDSWPESAYDEQIFCYIIFLLQIV